MNTLLRPQTLFITGAVLVLACFGVCPENTLAAPAIQAKFGHVAPPFHGQSKAAEAFAEFLKEKSGGRIEVALFPGGQLGGELSLAEQVQGGTLEIATVSTAVLQNFVPQAAVLDMPFLFPDRQTAYAVLDDPQFQEHFFSFFPAKGFTAIGWTENEIRDLSNSKRPVRTPEDLKGMKIRVMNSPLHIDTFKQLGASPVGLPFPEIYNALQTGVIDAQENPVLTTILMKFTEVTSYLTLTQHSLTECVVIVANDFWSSLSPEDQLLFRDAARVGIATNRHVNAELHQRLPGSGLSIDDYAAANNIELIRLSAEEREEFRKAMLPVWDKYRPKVGEELFDFTQDKISQYR
jgi:tripartite ATP-independent transporter DctP family solute receptor